MKKVLIIAIPVLLALFGGFFLWYELDARQVPPLLIAPAQDENPGEVAFSVILPEEEAEPMEEEPVEKTPTASHSPAATSGSTAIKASSIIIRGKSYPLKWNIEEATLKKHIGWMDTSAKPGDVGVCVVMGHRNQQLRCLKDVQQGDAITIIDAYGAAHSYTVESGKIVEDNNITFGATDRRELVLITCYPFYYSGHAPHQYVVTAVA